MANLYEIKNEFNTLWNILEDELVDDNELLDAFQTATEDLSEKLDNCCKYLKNQEAVIAGLKEEETRLKNKRQALENATVRLKGLMKEALEASGESKMTCGTFAVSVQNNAPSLVIDVDAKYIPSKYLIPQEPKIDKNLLKSDLKDGADLGQICHLEQSSSIRIR